MKERILNYVQETDKLINENQKIPKERLEYHLIQIEQFQHERLIHLIVTALVGILAILFLLFGLLMENIGLLIAFIALLCLFIPYILHYYLLENNVQKMYSQYDKLLKK
ncbi:MAG: hypothetical protein PUE33_00845 [bacterium]|nr:hypothetical protein [Mycoplasmatota bacterium]MDD6756596.1 hypothetical protein [bacterium]MDY2908094.1 hypothetical protein [Candidatus Faecimonas sp.]